eukprot:CAMPEP_0184342472 /NCGR_PEP_ID=MMETSP1089-20130417/11074_1 /TAXON_ID=38269 ORGANISM="Gloeochaete wittrockiana, Strain SAG46.84" /NCGR_SAMPLE_ID=MMETSP1089 /ASSEMBLY_ACC=CAM_ASM_000445 /LENGTH=701 /DNA_ID=CAMNT_0026671353 /DNA_START=195 /DNA_END=2300 /DNA_ORIENTATION=-
MAHFEEETDKMNPGLEEGSEDVARTAIEEDDDSDQEENRGRDRVSTKSNSKSMFKKPSLVSQESHFKERLDDESACALEWVNLKYSINTQSFPPDIPCCVCFSFGPCRGRGCFRVKEKKILHGVSGRASPGHFLAIMGASGSGKTTMLNILSQRTRARREMGTIHDVSGDILVNGASISADEFKKISAFVLQADALLPYLTVEETLYYAAQLRLPLFMSPAEKSRVVYETMQDLGLVKVRNTLIGNDFVRGVSGGEKRRVSIGVQLLTDPRILFLDEPTSGLDSKTALSIVHTLSDLAKNSNRTVVCTIHQPRASIFQLFDDLFIMAGGHPVYFGPSKKALGYFTEQGYPCPVHENPADFFIDLVTEEISNEEKREETKQRVETLIDSFKEINDAFKPEEAKFVGVKEEPRISQMLRWFSQVYWVAHRSAVNLQRNSELLKVRFLQTIFMAVIIGLLFLQLDNDQTSVNDRQGLLFFLVINISFGETLSALAIFGLEKLIFYIDRDAGAVSTSSYYIGRLIPELLLQFLIPAIYLTIVYWMTGLQSSWWRFGFMLLIIWSSSFVANSMALVLGAALPLPVAAILAPIAMIMNMLFGGFFVNTDNIPDFIAWIKYLSFVKYAFSALVQIEFKGLTFYCEDDQFITTSDGAKTCPVTEGASVVKRLDADELNPWECVAVLWAMVIIYRLLAYLALRFTKPEAL